jgi:hypothetical protein
MNIQQGHETIHLATNTQIPRRVGRVIGRLAAIALAVALAGAGWYFRDLLPWIGAGQ